METYPAAWVFFIVFILLTTFAVLNLFIAIVVDAMSVVEHGEQEKTRATVDGASKLVLAELRALREQVAELERQVTRD